MANENLRSASATAFLGHAVEAFSGTLKAGVKFQESLTLWWTDVLEPFGSVQTWNRVTRSVIHGVDAASSSARAIAAPVEKVPKVSARAAEEVTRRSVHAVEGVVNASASAPNGHTAPRRSAPRSGKKKGTAGGR